MQRQEVVVPRHRDLWQERCENLNHWLTQIVKKKKKKKANFKNSVTFTETTQDNPKTFIEYFFFSFNHFEA